MRMSGLLVCAVATSACVTVRLLEPYPAEEFAANERRIQEYVTLADDPVEPDPQTGLCPTAPNLRAWVREADRVIRANNKLREGSK